MPAGTLSGCRPAAADRLSRAAADAVPPGSIIGTTRTVVVTAATAATRIAGRRTRRLVGRADRSGKSESMSVVGPGAWRTSAAKAVRVMTDHQRQWRIREWVRPESVAERFVIQGLAQAIRAIR